MDNNVSVIRRSVKHARLKVREDLGVQLVVPSDFNDAQVDAILASKEQWIRKQQRFFRTQVREPCKSRNDQWCQQPATWVPRRRIDLPVIFFAAFQNSRSRGEPNWRQIKRFGNILSRPGQTIHRRWR